MHGYQSVCVALSLSCWLESVGVYNVIQCHLRGGESYVAVNLCVLRWITYIHACTRPPNTISVHLLDPPSLFVYPGGYTVIVYICPCITYD